MSKFVTLEELAAVIEDGQNVALGGMTMYRRPVGYVRALLRRDVRPRDLTLVCFTAGIESDLLVGANCVKAVRSVYFGLESFGLAPMFTEKANRGEITIIEETEASIAMGLRAKLSNIGFMPSSAWKGTDLPALRPDVKTIIDPYSGEELFAFPAIPIDVAVVHGLVADKEGNVLLNNNQGVDLELLFAAKKPIATVEKVVDKLERTTEGTLIPSAVFYQIAVVPEGASPTSCYPYYPIRGGQILDYIDACNAGNFEGFLETFV